MAGTDGPSAPPGSPGTVGAQPPTAGTGEIELGFPVFRDPDALNKAGGMTGVSQPDHRQIWNALINDVNRNGGLAGLSGQGLGKALTAIGGRFPSSLTFRTRFSEDQHDGTAAFRLYLFQDACGCFQYSGPFRGV